jgi:hypothetical protein
LAQIEVRSIDDNTEITNLSIDWRNGILKIHSPSAFSAGIYVMGYHYEWFLDDDLSYFADIVLTEHMFDRTDVLGFDDMSAQEKKAISIGTVVYALWSLMTEFSTQIDVSTPEGLMIPAHARFQQVQTLYQFWRAKYEEMLAMLNVGLNRISIKDLRRVSRLTNRYVPVFRGREIDDPSPPIRVFPPIDPITTAPEEGGKEGGQLLNDYGLSYDGWNTIGTSGG